VEQHAQHGVAAALAAELREHGHATDAAVRREAAGADRAAVGRLRERVRAGLVEPVPLEVRWHVLLDDEHGLAHRADALRVVGPARRPYRPGVRVHASSTSSSWPPAYRRTRTAIAS